MVKKKICMVGDFAVGKTSITQKFVNNVFSEKYLTTIGVKIDSLELADTKLIIWDVAGRDSLSPINASYLVGASGIVLVADGTRPQTVQDLPELWQVVEERIGNVPAVVALNKCDLEQWQVDSEITQQYKNRSWDCFATSAKESDGVAELFECLNQKIR